MRLGPRASRCWGGSTIEAGRHGWERLEMGLEESLFAHAPMDLSHRIDEQIGDLLFWPAATSFKHGWIDKELGR